MTRDDALKASSLVSMYINTRSSRVLTLVEIYIHLGTTALQCRTINPESY